MKFSTFITANLAVLGSAAAIEPVENQVDISLPPGCTKFNLISMYLPSSTCIRKTVQLTSAECALRLVGTTASCGAAIIEVGANPVADLSCIGSAANTAAKFDECKKCIPHKQNLIEN